MTAIKISSKVDESVWNELKALARDSHQNISGLLTEACLLGNIALRTGKILEWDGANFKITNDEQANNLLQREYRAGWTL